MPILFRNYFWCFKTSYKYIIIFFLTSASTSLDILVIEALFSF